MSKPKIDIQRIALDARGYDDNGVYYGAGDPVFLITLSDGHEQAIRAKTRAAARTRANELLATRTLAKSEAPPTRERAAKAKTHAARLKNRTTIYTTTWTHPLTRANHALTIRHTRDYLGQGQDHIEIDSGKSRAPHPLSETGYRSEFVGGLELINAGGPVTFVDRLIAKALREKTWLSAETKRAQGNLFDWADAQAEVGKRQAKSTRPDRARRARSATRAAKPGNGG